MEGSGFEIIRILHKTASSSSSVVSSFTTFFYC